MRRIQTQKKVTVFEDIKDYEADENLRMNAYLGLSSKRLLTAFLLASYTTIRNWKHKKSSKQIGERITISFQTLSTTLLLLMNWIFGWRWELIRFKTFKAIWGFYRPQQHSSQKSFTGMINNTMTKNFDTTRGVTHSILRRTDSSQKCLETLVTCSGAPHTAY